MKDTSKHLDGSSAAKLGQMRLAMVVECAGSRSEWDDVRSSVRTSQRFGAADAADAPREIPISHFTQSGVGTTRRPGGGGVVAPVGYEAAPVVF